MLSQITPLILTYNEAPNIERALEKLRWAEEVVVLDSFSSDETENIARSFANVVFAQRHFDSFAAQCNFGLERIKTEWVLSMDADYIVTDPFQDEISKLSSESGVAAYFARFRYCIAGHPLHGTLYPPRPVLFRKSNGRYVQDGHAHKLVFDGPSRFLQGHLLHDDRKPLSRWLDSQRAYARLEADKLLAHPVKARSLADRLRCLIWPAAPAAFVYTLLVKGCLFDGWPGWYYTLQRTYAELLLSLELLDRKVSGREAAQLTAK
ncbi:MAG TPA: glycosyltransferase family 2 protein [Pirellulales bacterium]|nr:glycosyltransferase family 2 protein [Pirellulales bacterium]